MRKRKESLVLFGFVLIILIVFAVKIFLANPNILVKDTSDIYSYEPTNLEIVEIEANDKVGLAIASPCTITASKALSASKKAEKARNNFIEKENIIYYYQWRSANTQFEKIVSSNINCFS
tara:strand:+ start:6039 stop:6398 length:360 start_codon:yes stop_codon:yes gene_type:complete